MERKLQNHPLEAEEVGELIHLTMVMMTPQLTHQRVIDYPMIPASHQGNQQQSELAFKIWPFGWIILLLTPHGKWDHILVVDEVLWSAPYHDNWNSAICITDLIVMPIFPDKSWLPQRFLIKIATTWTRWNSWDYQWKYVMLLYIWVCTLFRRKKILFISQGRKSHESIFEKNTQDKSWGNNSFSCSGNGGP